MEGRSSGGTRWSKGGCVEVLDRGEEGEVQVEGGGGGKGGREAEVSACGKQM